jgi:mRNA export factor
MAFFGASQPSQPGSSSTTGDLKNDVEINAAPEDGISEIQFSSVADYLAVSSWDRKVRVYEIAPTGQSQGKFFYEHDGPVLSCCWSKVRNTGRSICLTERRMVLN